MVVGLADLDDDRAGGVLRVNPRDVAGVVVGVFDLSLAALVMRLALLCA
jgi:hypothetical protein